MKIQQPVTTSTYTKYGQRYWRQPATKTQNKRNLDKRDSDSFPQHNKEGTNSIVTCCYVGSSVHLLVLRNNMHSCMTSIKSSDRSNLLEKTSSGNQTSKTCLSPPSKFTHHPDMQSFTEIQMKVSNHRNLPDKPKPSDCTSSIDIVTIHKM